MAISLKRLGNSPEHDCRRGRGSFPVHKYSQIKIKTLGFTEAKYKKSVEKQVWFSYNKEKVSKGVEQMERTEDNCAILKSDSQYTIFIFKDQTIRFVTSSKLERYTTVKEGDKADMIINTIIQILLCFSYFFLYPL